MYLNLEFLFKYLLILHFFLFSFLVSASYVPGPIPDSTRQRHAPLYGRLVAEEHLPASHRDVHQVIKITILVNVVGLDINNVFPFYSFFIICCNINSDQSVPHHRQTSGRCKREFQHIFVIPRRHHWGSWVLI